MITIDDIDDEKDGKQDVDRLEDALTSRRLDSMEDSMRVLRECIGQTSADLASSVSKLSEALKNTGSKAKTLVSVIERDDSGRMTRIVTTKED